MSRDLLAHHPVGQAAQPGAQDLVELGLHTGVAAPDALQELGPALRGMRGRARAVYSGRPEAWIRCTFPSRLPGK